MMSIAFLTNEALWHELRAAAKGRRRVMAAFAYFATGGAKLLPLKRGDIDEPF